MTLSVPGQELLDKYQIIAAVMRSSQKGGVVHVDEIAAKFAVFYEKVRNLVHYHDEHLVRKIFILRTMRRRLFLSPQKNIGEPLVREIVRAGHLANDSVVETKITEVQGIIDNYYKLVGQVKVVHRGRSSKKLSEWVLDLTVSAIEETLFPPDASDELAFDLVYKTIGSNLAVYGVAVEEAEKNIQLFIAMQRVFLRVDAAQLRYRLFKILYPDRNVLAGAGHEPFVRELPRIEEDFDKLLRGRLLPFFLKLCHRYNIVYSTIRDILNETRGYEALKEVLTDEEGLERVAKIVYERRLQEEFVRFKRIAVFSVISFFLSKIAMGLLIEIPLERAITHSFSMPLTVFSVLFPPVLMFIIIILFVRLPSKVNIRLIVNEVKKNFYDPWPREYAIQIPPKRNAAMDFFVRFFYFAISLGMFYLATRVLLSFGFTVANSIIFLLFTSLVMATGVRIYNRAQNLSLEKERAGMFAFFFDLFIMPFVMVGQQLIAEMTKFNIITIAINLFIELPFQIFIEFLENLRRFIKLKKEEIE